MTHILPSCSQVGWKALKFVFEHTAFLALVWCRHLVAKFGQICNKCEINSDKVQSNWNHLFDPLTNHLFTPNKLFLIARPKFCLTVRQPSLNEDRIDLIKHISYDPLFTKPLSSWMERIKICIWSSNFEHTVNCPAFLGLVWCRQFATNSSGTAWWSNL